LRRDGDAAVARSRPPGARAVADLETRDPAPRRARECRGAFGADRRLHSAPRRVVRCVRVAHRHAQKRSSDLEERNLDRRHRHMGRSDAESPRGQFVIAPINHMEFSINYSLEAAALLAAGKINIDRLKLPDWPNMIADAKKLGPVYVHFPL